MLRGELSGRGQWRSRSSCQWGRWGIALPCALPPGCQRVGGASAPPWPPARSSWGSPAREPLRFPGELRAGIRETPASAEDRGTCWGGTICFFRGERSRSGKWVKWKGAPPIGLGGRGRSAHPELKLRLPPSSLPSLLLHQCGKCSTDLHIFQTYVTFFFFPLCGRRRARIKKKKEEAGAVREKTRRHSASLPQTASTDTCA